jgi:hypothetical protein
MKYLFALFSSLLLALPAMAQESAPDALIKTVTNEVLISFAGQISNPATRKKRLNWLKPRCCRISILRA